MSNISRSYEYSDDYPTCIETYSNLRIFSDDLRPSDITQALQVQPTKSFSKGDDFGTRGLRRKATGWFYSTRETVKSRDTRRHIDELLSAFDEKDAVLSKLIELGCNIDICSYWLSTGHGGPCLEPEQMRRLSELKINIWWDVYFNDPDEK